MLYSRVLRDYLLYAADQEIIAVAWSPAILAEAVEHLRLNVARFDRAAAQRLVTAMNRAFPFAEVEPAEADFRALADVWLPDEDDRHVLAAAVAAEANVLCTWNVKDFPADAAAAAESRCSPPTSCSAGSWQNTSHRCSPLTERLSRP